MTSSRWEPDAQGNEEYSAQCHAGVSGRISACFASPCEKTASLQRFQAAFFQTRISLGTSRAGAAKFLNMSFSQITQISLHTFKSL